MTHVVQKRFYGYVQISIAVLIVALGILLGPVFSVRPAMAQDPAEPPNGPPKLELLPGPAGKIDRASVDEKSLRATIDELVSCGTRDSFSSWTDPKRGIGCARDHIVARFQEIAKESGGRLQVVVDKFETALPRTREKLHLENVYAILPGTDPALAKTVFMTSGHYDSRPSQVNDPTVDAPGADDDGSGVAVSVESARLLAKGTYRATLLFAAVSGEEQGLLGGQQMLKYLQEHGYTIGGFLDNDIVGADSAPGGPHRARVFSGGGPDGVDSPSRELARAVDEIDGRDNIRLIFRLDRIGRGGDHMPFVRAGLPAVRFTEPQENYDHQHQTVRTENGRVYGDLPKYLDYTFMGNVARDNAEVLRELALAPAPPAEVTVWHEPRTAMGWAQIRWQAAPGQENDPQRAGFEILRRETTAPQWSVYQFVNSGNEVTLDGVSPDNYFFAVRSVGKNGARSLAVPAVLPMRRPPGPQSGTPPGGK
jgi:hypothetical protein